MYVYRPAKNLWTDSCRRATEAGCTTEVVGLGCLPGDIWWAEERFRF